MSLGWRMLFFWTGAVCTAPASWVAGTVYLRTADTRTPMAKVVVTARSAESHELVATARTTADGGYEFRELPPGSIVLTASRSGHYSRAVTGGNETRIVLDYQPGRPYARNDFELFRAGVIAGRVTDELGEPVAEARISLRRSRNREARGWQAGAGGAVTDDRGVFRIAGLEPDSYLLDVVPVRPSGSGAYYEAAPVEVNLKPGGEIQKVELTLQRFAIHQVSGTLAGIPYPGLQVLFESLRQPDFFVAVTVDEEGRFRTRIGLPPGPYRVSAMPGGARKKSKPLLDVLEVRGDIADLALRPTATATVVGRVTLPSGTERVPLAQAGVALQSEAGVQFQKTDENGGFRFPDLIPGRYRICAWREVPSEALAAEEAWQKAGCAQRFLTIEPGGQVELALTAAP